MASLTKKIFCILQLLLLLCSTFVVTEADSREKQDPEGCVDDIPWSYSGSTGPEHWAEIGYKECGGQNQSPIKLPRTYHISNGLRYVKAHYYGGPVRGATLINDGRKVKLVLPEKNRPRIYHGRKYGYYDLHEIHFHFGSGNENGSEHELGGVKYALEAQAVCKNSKGNTSITIKFFEYDDYVYNNSSWDDYQPIFDQLHRIRFKGQSTVINKPLDFQNFFGRGVIGLYGYDGSLTSPPCTEGVLWWYLKRVILTWDAQISKFRELYRTPDTDECLGKHKPIYPNSRPLQPRGRRLVLT